MKRKTLKEEVAEYKDKYLRALAELENYKKRAQKEREEILGYANERLVFELLGILDDFERGLGALKGVKDKKLKEFYRGVELIHNNLVKILEQEGLKSFSGVGEPFDPRFHEAVGVKNSKKHPPNYVVVEISKGYKLKDKVIKPAKVLVNQKS
ncbi:nucleotide exchange factor GrpE [candidate division WOR-3 bacterium]|nr:nucleotide exchange factor GrpE [candidate division WOR-3 bacterium]